MPDEEIDPNETYYPGSDLKAVFDALNKKVDSIKDELTPDEVKTEKAKYRTPTVKDLDERDDRLIEKLTNVQKAEKNQELAVKSAVENYEGVRNHLMKVAKSHDMKWNDAKQKMFDGLINDVSRNEAIAARDEKRAIDWDGVNQEVVDLFQKNFDWESPEEESEDGEVEESEEEDNEDEEETKSSKKSEPQKRKSMTVLGSGVDIDPSNSSQIRQMLKEVEGMSRSEAMLVREKVLRKLPNDVRKALYNREKVLAR